MKKTNSTQLQQRSIWIFAVLTVFFGACIVRLYAISSGTELAAAAQAQRHYTVSVADTRGTVYDCKLRPITNSTTRAVTVATATPTVVTAIQALYPRQTTASLFKRLQSGKPTVFQGALPPQTTGAQSFFVPEYYSTGFCAPHVIGYLNADGNGVCGVEQSYQDLLADCGGKITVRYQTDAWGRVLNGEMVESVNTAQIMGGVVLTLDREVQQMAEQIAADMLPRGAIVILESKTAKIRAMVSTPSFNPADISDTLQQTDSPLINRALCAYNVGSVFKLVTACCAAESGETTHMMQCDGVMTHDDRTFQCIGAVPHGEVGISRAVAVSCNCYFIRLAARLGAQSVYRMAERLGFGQKIWLTSDLVSESGRLPSLQDLSASAALANFSFGQGDLLATPLQIAGMVQAIANDGQRVEPSIVEYTIDKNGIGSPRQTPYAKRVLTTHSAGLARGYMVEAVTTGSANRAMPAYGGAGAKTATAETGWFIDGEAAVQAWCAGFYPAESAQYVIVVFAENGRSGSATAAPIFQRLADGLYALGVVETE